MVTHYQERSFIEQTVCGYWTLFYHCRGLNSSLKTTSNKKKVTCKKCIKKISDATTNK